VAIKQRLHPSDQQVELLARHCSDARFVWNLALEQRNLWRAGRAQRVNTATQMRELAELRREFEWLGQGSSSVQQAALRDLDRAFQNWWTNPGHFGRPTWRSVAKNEGFCIRDLRVHKLNRKWAEVSVPKAGYVKFRLTRAFSDVEAAKSARVTLDGAGHWHVSFTAAQPPVKRQSTGSMVGIDRGVATTLATSRGEMFRIPQSPKLERRATELQRQLSRQKRGSKRRAATKDCLAKTHARTADRRRDWVEKTTTRLVRDNDVIVLEKLNTKNMLATPSPKPDPENEGQFLPNGRAAKAGLNRSISRACWGLVEHRLVAKAEASGVKILFINPKYTSQECRQCGHTAPENRESQAVFHCVNCDHTNHADLNAAQNILARAEVQPAPTPGHGASRRKSAGRTSPALPAAPTSELEAA